jgi:photosystem II stability/assembly factor-like uncharacterized protein
MHRSIVVLGVLLLTQAASVPGRTSAQNWTRITDVPPDETIRFHSDDPILLTGWASVVRSRDAGASWDELAPLQSGAEGLADVITVGGVIYVASHTAGVLFSNDDGDSWQDLSSGLTGMARKVLALAVLQDTLYAATDGAGVYRLASQSAHWHAFNDGLGPG